MAAQNVHDFTNYRSLTKRDLAQDIHLLAAIALIDQQLTAGSPIPGRAAQTLINALADAGLARVTLHADQSGQITLHHITATCTGGPLGLLRNWQSAAKAQLFKRQT